MVTTISLVIVSMFATHWLIQKRSYSPIRASSFVSLIIVLGLTYLSRPADATLYSGAVLGGTFLGMTDPGRLQGKYLLFAASFFSFSFLYLLPYNRGFGGALGFTVFLSCTSTYLLNKIREK